MLGLLCASLLAGCAFKFIYNQLDWLIPWYLDDYVSINPVQEMLLDKRLEQYLRWHRSEQLPHYADFLDQVAELSKDGLSAAELDLVQQQTQLFVDTLIARMVPELADFFSQMDEIQYQELFDNIAVRNEKFRQRYIELDDRKQRINRLKEVRKFVQRWTGLLEEEQIKMLVAWSKQYHLMGEEFLRSRLAWQQRLDDVLQQREKKDVLESGLLELLIDDRSDRSEAYRQKYEDNEKLLKQLYLSLDRSLTVEQRQHMLQQLQNYASDFRELAKNE